MHTKLICPTHPRYLAKVKPRKSKNFPNGCSTCWAVYLARKRLNDLTKNLIINLDEGNVAGQTLEMSYSLYTDTLNIVAYRRATGHSLVCAENCDTCLTRDVFLHFHISPDWFAEIGEWAKEIFEVRQSVDCALESKESVN